MVVGAGAAGLTAGALLAHQGRSVVVVDRDDQIGGRAMVRADEGFQLHLGGHHLEDPGSGITSIFQVLGLQLEHGPTSSDLLVFEPETKDWATIRDRYSADKAELKKLITTLVATPFEELDDWDDRTLREWLNMNTSDQGVKDLFEYLAVLECLTEDWWDHSASENLFVRKMHYQERRTAGYSTWPVGGWNALFGKLAKVITDRGGQVRLNTAVETVLIERGEVAGVRLNRPDASVRNEVLEGEVIEASAVICTVPVWEVLSVVPEHALPTWYARQIRHFAVDATRVTWAGLWLATTEPAPISDRMELLTWRYGPNTGTSGFLYEYTSLDQSTAPPGYYLYSVGSVLPSERARDSGYLQEHFRRFEADVSEMNPGLANAAWTRRHLVHDPSFGVRAQPTMVGRYRPHWQVPNIEGLLFASESFRSRGIGIDRAARAGLTAVETYLGHRVAGLDETWRYGSVH
ncbi:MAG TPA: FAD-dependent oxidoreductase [Pseudonocardia sp.]